MLPRSEPRTARVRSSEVGRYMGGGDVDVPRPARRDAVRASFLRDNRVTLVAGGIATMLAAVVWFALPHEREVSSLAVLLFKLTPFAAASVAIAWLNLSWAHRLHLPLIAPPVCFLVFFCYFVPKIAFYSGDPDAFPDLYYHLLTLVPFVILALVLAYRLGGGSRSGVLRLSAAMLLLQLSGIEDLAFLLVNDHTDPKWTPIPDVWTWASHMTVFFGQPLTQYQAYGFIGVHLVLALLVLFLPAGVVTGASRWAKTRLGAAGGRTTIRTQSGNSRPVHGDLNAGHANRPD